MVNLRARRGSERIAHACRVALPSARVLASRTLGEAEQFARSLCDSPPDLVISAGGDGTALALLNAVRALCGTGRTPLHFAAAERCAAWSTTALGILPLGTGNAWAGATGAPNWRRALAELRGLAGRTLALPRCRFDLIEVDGTVAHFAGSGWDAELIDDFNAQKDGFGLLPKRNRHGVAGYLQGMLLRALPRHLARRSAIEIELINTGEDALTVDPRGRAVPLRGGEHGKVLYRGPMSLCGAGTTRAWGFGFQAFPFAALVPRRFHMRVYSAHTLEALRRSADLWRGHHLIPGMRDWLLTRCRAVFSRPTPFQLGGDRLGHREGVEFVLAAEQVDLLNWTAL